MTLGPRLSRLPVAFAINGAAGSKSPKLCVGVATMAREQSQEDAFRRELLRRFVATTGALGMASSAEALALSLAKQSKLVPSPYLGPSLPPHDRDVTS
jgi:hypothetical protein